MRARDLIENFPDFEASGGQVSSPEGPLKGMTPEQVAPNVVLFYSPEGNFIKAPGWVMVYFTDTEQAAADLRAQKIMPPMFMPGSMSMRFSGYSMINDIWKKKRVPSGQDAAMYDGMRHVVGALEAYVDEKGIFVDNISVRPGWKKNTVGSKLMNALVRQFPGRELTHSDTTKAGHSFLKKTGYLRHNTADGGGQHAGAAGGALRVGRVRESVATQVVARLVA